MDSGSIDFKTGIELLQNQIGRAEHLLKNRPLHSQDHTIWNNTTRDCLTKIYGPGSPNIQTIVRAPGSQAVWLGMPKAAAERYEASCIENKIQLLEGCIASLRQKAQQSSGRDRAGGAGRNLKIRA
jgi:hypothetical protein